MAMSDGDGNGVRFKPALREGTDVCVCIVTGDSGVHLSG